MKKTLALILAILVAFSMFTVATFAEGEVTGDGLVTVKFLDDDGTEIKVFRVPAGQIITAYIPANPEKADTETTRYTFKGWRSDFDGELYYTNSSVTIPAAYDDATDHTVIFVAEYSEKDISGRQNLMQFFKSIFERINLIFEYFATIFNFSD